MTVKELREQLAAYPDDLEVLLTTETYQPSTGLLRSVHQGKTPAYSVASFNPAAGRIPRDADLLYLRDVLVLSTMEYAAEPRS